MTLALGLTLGAIVATFLLMASTSTELGGWMVRGKLGHKYAQAYGAFLAAGLVLFAATSWILLRAGRGPALRGGATV